MRAEIEEKRLANENLKADNEKLTLEKTKLASSSSSTNQNLMKELTTVVTQNADLNGQCQILADEI